MLWSFILQRLCPLLKQMHSWFEVQTVPAKSIKVIKEKIELSLTWLYVYHVTYEFQSESTVYNLTECQGTPCSKQVPYLKVE